MPSTGSTNDRRPSAELARRLRARARRARVLRRRVVALTLVLMLAAWGAVYTVGSLGTTAAAPASTIVAAVHRTYARKEDDVTATAASVRTTTTATSTTATATKASSSATTSTSSSGATTASTSSGATASSSNRTTASTTPTAVTTRQS